MNQRVLIVSASFMMMCILLFISPSMEGYYTITFPSDINTGPYVNHIEFKVIANQDQRVLALQAGDIEMDTTFFDPVHLHTLEGDPNINIFSAYRNGYGHITINCQKYPLNISALRRAFAFAYDKTQVKEEIMDGFSIEHDSLVALPNGWCAEEEFEWHYYDARPDIGNAILDAAGFEIDDGTGYRLAPDGSAFNITIEYISPGGEIAGGTCQIGVYTLESLHIEARTRAVDYNECLNRLNNHGDYDMVLYAVNFYDNDVDWLAYDYWSEYADVFGENPTNFRNATYDSWRDQLLHGITYEEVFEAVVEMQKILQYNVPRLVVYENAYMQAYRNDVFTGQVEDILRYISGPWTMRKIHRLDGALGGTVPVAISEEPDSFNIFVDYSAFSAFILCELWPSLFRYSPAGTPWPDLAETMLTETHSDNLAVPEGRTRFTIDIIQNATWSDGVPLTAEDIAFTFTYIIESAVYGNPTASELGDLLSAYAPSLFRVVLEFATESYWHFNNFAYQYIIPKHIFNDEDGIGYEGWNTWNPIFDPEEPNVNCGPFIFSDFEEGNFYRISKNPLFQYQIPDEPPPDTTASSPTTSTTLPTTSTTTSTTTTSQTTANQTTQQQYNWSLVLTSALGAGSAIVIIYCIVLIMKTKKTA